jgi:hypothetical protein
MYLIMILVCVTAGKTGMQELCFLVDKIQRDKKLVIMRLSLCFAMLAEVSLDLTG